MVQVTQEATKHLVRVRRERGFDTATGARFVSRGSSVTLTFAPAPQPGDGVAGGKEIPIYVAPQVAEKLDSAVIDIADRDGRVGLVLRHTTKAKPSRS
jgi:Fe-S cluster assembly iron-binding protein IscA